MNKKDQTKLNRVLAKVMRGMKPPEDLTVSQWADKYRRLPRSAAEPGQWRTSRTPYLREPMDAFSDPKVHSIVMVASSQVGKSEFEMNCIGYAIHQNPGNILYIHPDTDEAKKFSRLRVTPLIRESKVLRDRVAKEKSRDSGNTVLSKTFPGGMLLIVGSHVPSDLASTPCRYVIGDEQDRWAPSAGNEGDPWELATARQITFRDYKNIRVSTPTVKDASKIEKAYAEGTMERWCVQCQHCGAYNDIHFSDIRYTAHERIVKKKRQWDISDIFYVCPSCGGVSTEREVKRQPAKWVAENPDAYKRGVRSFWLNSFVSPWATWESSILKYQYALGDSSAMQVVYNTRFGELWELRGESADEDSLLARREDYGAQLPEGVLVLTAGVDQQDNRMEYEIVGYGHWGENWGIEKGVVLGRPDADETWEQLDELVFNRKLSFADGVKLPVSISFVDDGGHYTMQVRQRCDSRLMQRVFAIKGDHGFDKPFISPPKRQQILLEDGASIGSCWHYMIGVSAGKQLIMDDLTVQTPGPRYCHFPRRDDYGPSYFNGLLSEAKVVDMTKKNPVQWKKLPGHERNEPLDCRNYANAAFKALPKDLDAIDLRLKVLRGQAPAPETKPTPAAPKRKPAQREKKYDDW